jgi:hypothetical protein
MKANTVDEMWNKMLTRQRTDEALASSVWYAPPLHAVYNATGLSLALVVLFYDLCKRLRDHPKIPVFVLSATGLQLNSRAEQRLS